MTFHGWITRIRHQYVLYWISRLTNFIDINVLVLRIVNFHGKHSSPNLQIVFWQRAANETNFNENRNRFIFSQSYLEKFLTSWVMPQLSAKEMYFSLILFVLMSLHRFDMTGIIHHSFNFDPKTLSQMFYFNLLDIQ